MQVTRGDFALDTEYPEGFGLETSWVFQCFMRCIDRNELAIAHSNHDVTHYKHVLDTATKIFEHRFHQAFTGTYIQGGSSTENLRYMAAQVLHQIAAVKSKLGLHNGLFELPATLDITRYSVQEDERTIRGSMPTRRRGFHVDEKRFNFHTLPSPRQVVNAMYEY